MPALSDNRVFVHNDVSAFALELLTKESKLCWRFDTDLREQLVQDERVLHTTIVANGIAYVPLVANIEESWRSENLFNLDVTCGFPKRAIYAFDAMGGKLLWSTAGSTDEFLRTASFAMAPAFDSGNLYAGAVYMSEQNAPMEHFICCLDAATGRLKWKTYLCSGFLEVNLFNNPVRESLGSAVTISNGMAFYCSNMGAAAAVDLIDGRIVWLNRYRQFEIPPTRNFYPPLMPSHWANNPPVLCSGAVFFTPMDSPYLYGFDAATGQKRWEWNPKDLNVTFKHLLGVSGDCLVLTGQDVIALDVKRGLKMKWSVTPTEAPAGRGGISREFVYVPTVAALYKIGIAGGKISEVVEWPSGFPRGGNFLMFNGAVIITSNDGVTACFNEDAMHSALRLQAEKTPKDPAALYRLGMSHVSRRQFAEALQSLSRVIEVTSASGQENSPVAASARIAVQSVHVELARQKAAEGKADEAIAEFVLAKKSSNDPRRSVEVAFVFAEQLVKLGRNDRAVEELQWVIERFPSEVRDGGIAREHAAKMIADVILQAGRAPYAPQEAKAAAMLDAASKANDEAALQKLVLTYPNSLASERAVLELARRQRGSGRLDKAIDTLRSFAKGSQRSAALPEALALLVECYETRGMYGSARAVLNQMQRRFAGTRLPESSGGIPVAEFVKSRLALKEYAASTGSDKMTIDLPLKLAWQYREPVGTLRVVRITGTAPDDTPQIVLVETQKALVALSAANGTALWQTPRTGALVGAGFCRGRLVLCDNVSLTALDPKSGVREYSVSLKSRQVRSFKVGGEHVFISSFDPSQPVNMKLTCYDGQSGKEAWTHSVSGQFVSDPAVTDEWIVFAMAPSNEIVALEKETGADVFAIPFGAPIATTFLMPPDRIFVADRSGVASCLELPSGKALWRQPIQGLRPDMTQVNGTHVVLLSTSPSGRSTGSICAIDAASGKLSLSQPIASGEFPRNIAADDDRAYVVNRTASNSSQTTLNAYNILKAGEKWSCPIETDGASTSFPPIVAEKHVLLGVSVFDAANRAWANRAYVMDSETGKLVQVLAPEGISNSPGTLELFDGVVICVHGGRLFAYGKQ
jgi:outer membrane protein assembly factor BamB/TolA-binding protein